MDVAGILTWWWNAVRDVMINPHSFFHSLENEEDFHSPSVFLLVTQVFATVLLGIGALLGGSFGALPLDTLQLLGMGGVVLVIVVVLYFLLRIVVSMGTTLVLAGFFNIFYYYLGGVGRLSSTFKVLAYLSAFTIPTTLLSMLVALVPALSSVVIAVNLLIGLYALYVGIVGFSIRHDISKWRAAAPYIFLLLLILAMVGLIMVVSAQMQSMMGGLSGMGTTSSTLPS